ncbi:MAG: hypothetical protein GY940_24330, partial [bacterium]|nr:hypothetical protein [bacterium]
PWSPLVAIQAGGDQTHDGHVHGEETPLFCVHPVGGNVLCYFELARHLGKGQPFYGLQAFGLEPGQTPYTKVTDMAERYLEALKNLQPQGPYQLAGWSFGGVVAFEIACRLQARGESVALLALFDAAVPSTGESHPEPGDDAEFLAALLAQEEISLSLEHLRRLTPDERLTYVIEQGKQDGFFPPDVEPVQVQRLLKVFKTNVQAAQSYQPGSYRGRITYFQAVERPGDIPLEPGQDWEDYAVEGVEIIPVPGNHHNMVKPPHVRVLAEKLKIYLGNRNEIT